MIIELVLAAALPLTGGANAHIKAKIADCDRYAALNPHFAKAFAFLKRGDLASLKPGRYEIDGDNCWAMVQEVGLTPFADGAKVEAHRKYVDIQSPLTGEETIGEVTMDEKLRSLPFNEEKDFVLFDAPSRPVTLKPGEFAIYFPPDGAHAPGHCAGAPRTIRKLVIKVRDERPAACGLVVDPAKESMDFAVPKGLKGFAWGKLQWDARCAVAVERTGNLPADVVARASKYPGGRILAYACRTNDAPGKVDFAISLAAGGGTLRGAKTFAVDAADRQVETVAHYDNYGNLLVSLGPREGLLVDADPFAQMPFADLSGETDRQFVIAEGTPKFYNGHPTMTACESPDHLIAVWTSEHAGPCGPAAESLDGGKTWRRIDERFPAEWKKAINCPSVYYLKGPDGKSRLWAWANAFGKRELASMMPSVMSEDNGKTWKLMPPLGERFRCVMAFTSVVQLPDGRCFAAFHRSQKALKGGWQDVAPHEVAGTFSSDGGFTWSDPFVVASDPAGEEWYCEPGVFLSPDGTELCCLLREQHRGLSRMCFSKDFGKTWSKPVPTSRGVSGHRHVAHVLPDGRVAVALRSWYQPLENPRRDPHFGCWIGPYSSIRAGTDADAMMVKLLEPKPGKAGYGSWDTGYPAFAINAAGEIVAATYIHYRADENRHSIAGIRFDPREFGCGSLRKSDSFLETPIAPIGENGQAAWNARARWFIYAPTFGFTNSNKAASYRFTVTDDRGVVRIFTAKKATAALSPVWNELPTGYVEVKAEGLDEKGEVVSFAGSRRFWKAEPFRAGAYPAAKRSYAEAAKAICDYIVSQPHMKHLEKTGEIDMSYALNGYPSKMFSAQIGALTKCGKTELAKRLADRLIARSELAGAPLEFFTLTYDGGGHKDVSKKYADLIMLKYPAVAGLALLDVAEATGEPKYREHAVKVADTYLKLQGDDGTWFLKLNRKTGKAANPNRLVPTEDVVPFLERVSKITGEQKYREAAERAVAFVENGSVRTWNWDAQFEDVEPKEPYRNLTEHGVASYAIYLAERYPNDRAKLALARELVRFCEDQFICWSEPYAGHELPPGETRDNWATCFQDWVYPCSLEQYGYYVPIDASAAKMIRAYLALYRVTDNLEDLAKARALGNVMTQTQSANGRLRTWWRKPVDRADNGDDWDNCMIASAEALEELAKFDVEELRSKACK